MKQNMQYNQQIGANLKRLRCRSGCSQQQLCEELQGYGYEIQRSTYSKYETGAFGAAVGLLAALHQIYHWSYEEIFGETEL